MTYNQFSKLKIKYNDWVLVFRKKIGKDVDFIYLVQFCKNDEYEMTTFSDGVWSISNNNYNKSYGYDNIYIKLTPKQYQYWKEKIKNKYNRC